jgi:serine/threonine protein kinase
MDLDIRKSVTLLQSGDLLRSRYRIRAELSRGGMGAVYLAEDTSLAGRLCAVKQMLDLGSDMDEYMKARFLSEMEVLARLRHPAIPNVRDFFQEQRGWFLVMDYIQGKTLEAELEAHLEAKTHFSSHQTVADALVVLDVLQHLHTQTPQLLHRDIKPANLIRDQSSGNLIVVDFGLARTPEEQQSSRHTSVGTLGYSSLEQLTGKPEVRSDLYSLGVTLHEMVSGIRPTLAGVEPLTTKNWPEFDADLAFIIERAAHQNLKKRYSSAGEFREALLQWQRSKTVAPLRSQTGSHRKTGVFLLLVSSLVVCLVLALRGPGKAPVHSHDPGLKGDLFSSRTDGSSSVVGLGEDVGLFWIEGDSPEKTSRRAETVARRLNYLYHHQCLQCGSYLLEPEGILVGRYQRNSQNNLVVFYLHRHGKEVAYGPELLVTVSEGLAKQLKVTPRFAAGYWRNLTRDVVALSRGETSQHSPLGPAFLTVVNDIRQKGSDASLQRLKAAVSALSSKQASILRNAFREVPEDFRFEADSFTELNGFKPLAN